MKWYTAIGVKRNSADRRFYVRCGTEDKVLTGMEIQIWSTLLWAFCEEKDIFVRMMGLLTMAFGEEETRKRVKKEEFQYCLRRLETRGLIASSEGETAEEAEEELIRRVTMVRVRCSRHEKMQLFLNSMEMGKGLRFSLRAFAKTKFTLEEENILNRLDEDGRIDSHLRRLEQKAGQRASFVEGDDTEFSRSVQQEFLSGVIALYGRKQLMIESIRKEGLFEEREETAGYVASAGLHP